jgi:hypothetical protein
MKTNVTVRIPIRQHEDYDDCLSAAETDYAHEHNLVGWDLEPRWEDDQRDAILLTVPGPKIEVSEAKDTNIVMPRGRDVQMVVTLPGGAQVEGTVTLLPAVDGRPEYESWGEPGHWIEEHLLRALTRAYPGHNALRRALTEIEMVASAQCGVPEDD